MNRRSKSSRRPRGSSKNPQQSPTSDHLPQPSSSMTAELLPRWLERNWTADEVWALMSQTERSWSARQFSDTPEYWKSITPFFPSSSAENLRNIHLSILKFERNVAIWKQDEIQRLIASVYENMQEPMDTPQWWGEVASYLPGRNALDCRIAFNTYGMSRVKTTTDAQPQQKEMRRPSVPSSSLDFVSTSSQRSSAEPLKTMSEGKPQLKQQTMLPSVLSSTMEAESTSSQRTAVEPPKTKSEARQKQQQQQTMPPSVPSSARFPGGTSFQGTSVVPLQNWALKDYMFLMKILTINLHVDTDNAGAMESIASVIGEKTGEEVRHLILKWRPHLLAALEKADRIPESSSGTIEQATSDSSHK